MTQLVTYSPAYTLVPTYECFNRCSYCNFRVDIGKDFWLTVSAAGDKLKRLPSSEIAEILILSGEVHPASSKRHSWFMRIYQLCELVLSLGFLPHSNVGPLSWWEMEQLKVVNVSMGLMLEQLNPKFLTTVHQQAPSKQPQLRLQQLEWAGKLQIPFTTGLLLGIGETKSDRQETLEAIATINQKWGNIQEVILQPHSLGSKQQLNAPNFAPHSLLEVITQARTILPDSIAIQIPPNLVTESQLLLDCLAAGASDLGGISPKDEVNPDYPHPTRKYLNSILEPKGWKLKARLPVYPQYYSWLSPSLQNAVKAKENTLKCV
ncbi:7,8-didemethyl-8-hydroxy-5-deazariboflavin synthase subunit CofG [Myxosarcina sp. GI1(2024)]